MILAAYYHPILATLFALAAVLLMGVILLQRGKGVGLSGAFGGAGGHTAFGAKTGDVLTWITIIVAVIVLTGAVVLNYVFVPPKLAAAPPPAPAPVAPAPVPITPAAADEGTTPAASPQESPAPSESAPPTETTEPPAEAPETPEESWYMGEGVAWPAYARRADCGADLS